MNHSPWAYTFHADTYCATCGAFLPEIDPEGNEKGYVYSWETWAGMSCGECGDTITETDED